QGKLSLNVYPFQWLIRIILRHQLAGSFLKILKIFVLPPVLQVAVRIIATALIVKTMGNLMANHRADTAIIDRCIRLIVVEGRLQNPCGENNLVPSWI